MVSVACWALLLSSYSDSINAQVDPTTGNLINFSGTPTATTGNWVNGVYVNSLTCWELGGPGNCGPNPNVQRTGNINFSYGAIDLYQVININQALRSAGTNLQVTGFNFGFMAKNGNGWDNGQQDYLSAYVKFLKSNGSVALTYDYTQYTNRQYNWTNFNFSETFANPSLATGYRAAQVGFIGKDSNNLAGPYGPEISNVSFNLKYRVDPCATDPTSSPACPGFAAAMNSKNTVTTPAATPVVESTTIPASTVSTQPKIQTDTAPLKPQSKILALALSIISKNRQQEQEIQNVAVQTATTEAANMADRVQQQAVSVASSMATMSQQTSVSSNMISADSRPGLAPVPVTTTKVTAPAITSVAVSIPTVDNQNSVAPVIQSFYLTKATVTSAIQPTQENITSTQPPINNSKTTSASQPMVMTIAPVATKFSQSSIEDQQSNIVTAYIQPQNTMFYTMTTIPTEQSQQSIIQPVSFTRQTEVEQVNNTTSFMTNRTDPLNEIVESKPILTTAAVTESAQTVKTNVASNELAGGVDINKMALTPVGYSNYTNLMLKDGKMYEPKEIYKNQTPVDNARALRQLSTDRLHQQMIEQQYRR